MNRDSAESGLPSSSPDLSRFGLDVSDEEWLGRVRCATRAPCLGRLGEYELLAEISRGAQGVVYQARRIDAVGPVAIKRLLAGAFATGVARARFERELEAVATLSHPNIVRSVEIGSSERHPLLVMEWIDGVPIDRWADQSRSPGQNIDAVLNVFLETCDAVHHAHQRGVIHRDLKPSNILVDAAGRPHLLDFGLAKITGADAALGSTVTGTNDFLGTPAYAAPEQVRGEQVAVDVRTDVYALGVILFRMLTGCLPFDSTRGLADLLADIQHTEAARPSRLNRALRHDLDAIIGKAMAKDADWRYASVDALVADVRRYLNDEPVEAQRGRRWYELRKTIQRHRAAVGVLLTVLLIVSGAALALWMMYVRQGQFLAQVTSARDAEARARHSALQQQNVLEELLSAAAAIGKGTDLDVRRAWLDEATRLVEIDLLDEPNAQAAAHDAIGRTYQSLGLYPEAENHLRRALELRRLAHPEDHPDFAASLNHLGALLQDRNRFAEAEPFLRDALSMRQRLHTTDHPDLAESLNSAGLILQHRHEYSAAHAMHNQALEMQRRLFGNQHADLAHTLNLIGNLHLRQSQFASAESQFRDVLGIYCALFGMDHREVAGAKVNLAKALFNLGEYTNAEPLFREAVDGYRRLLGNAHDNVAWGLHRLGVLLHAKGDFADAESSLREALEIYRRCFGNDDHYVALVLNSLGNLLMDRGHLPSARPLFDEAVAIQERLRPLEGPGAAWRLNRVAEWLERAGDHDAAAPLLHQIIDDPNQAEAMEFVYVVRCMNSLARIHVARGEHMAAEALCRRALELRRDNLGAEHPDIGQSLVNLAGVLRVEGRLDEADALVQQGIELQRRALGNDHPELARSLNEVASIADALGNPARAHEALHEGSQICARRECPQ